MMNKFVSSGIFLWFVILFVFLFLGYAILPSILSWLGFNRPYFARRFFLNGKRALIIATNHGVYASELTTPYFEFRIAQMQVDIASITGGEIPFDPKSIKWPLITPDDRRFISDQTLMYKLSHSLKIENLDFTKYDIIFIAGGYGAAYDLGNSDILGKKLTLANFKGVILGSVCGGALGFLLAKKPDGSPLTKGLKMTAVTDKQAKELGLSMTANHPETELRKIGALFESKTAFRDIFANHVCVDGNIVTGQNQNASAKVAEMMMGLVEKKG